MSLTPEPRHLSKHHRNTLRLLFQHPVSRNIEWIAVVSLLEAVGSVTEQNHGKVAVTVGSETEYFDPRHIRTSTSRQLSTFAGCWAKPVTG
jgi:hypothetical protein